MADQGSDIETAITQPKSASVDGNSVTAHDLDKQLDANDRRVAKSSVTSRKGGIFLRKIKPNGSI